MEEALDFALPNGTWAAEAFGEDSFVAKLVGGEEHALHRSYVRLALGVTLHFVGVLVEIAVVADLVAVPEHRLDRRRANLCRRGDDGDPHVRGNFA